MFFIGIVVLDQCSCAKSIVKCLWIFFCHELYEKARGRCNYPSKQHYNPVIHQRFREPKIQVVMLPGPSAKPKD